MNKGRTWFISKKMLLGVCSWLRERALLIFSVAEHLHFPQSVHPQICTGELGGGGAGGRETSIAALPLMRTNLEIILGDFSAKIILFFYAKTYCC